MSSIKAGRSPGSLIIGGTAALVRSSAGKFRAVIPRELRLALMLFVALRLGCSLYALVLSQATTLAPPCFAADPETIRHADGFDFLLTGVWQRNDACAYERIAQTSYRANDGAVAFFPLYPLLMRFAGLAFGGHLTAGGLLVSAFAYIAAMIGMWRLVRDDFGEQVAGRAVLYLSIFPTAIFLFAPYTEALFLALTVWTLLLARRGSWLAAAPLAFLAGLTRTQGVLLALPLAWEFFSQWRAGRCRPQAALVTILPLVSFTAFALYAKVVSGYTPFSAQQLWGVQNRAPWDVLRASWLYIRTKGDPVEALNLIMFGLAVGLIVSGVRRLPLTYLLYALPHLLTIVIRENGRTPLQSTSRYLLIVFPIMVVLALVLKSRRAHVAWVVVSFVLFIVLLTCYLGAAFVA
jgi:hypothetical protein